MFGDCARGRLAPSRRERSRFRVPLGDSIVGRDRTAYVTVIWGTALHCQVEAFFLGLCLQRTSTRRRIAYVAADTMFDGMVDLLESVWEVRRFGYVRAGEEPAYYKMQAWGRLASELDVAVLLDTDVVVRDCMDSIFDLVCAEAAGVRWCKGAAKWNQWRVFGFEV